MIKVPIPVNEWIPGISLCTLVNCDSTLFSEILIIIGNYLNNLELDNL